MIIKKLFLAIIGGVLASSAFYWYLDKENPLLQMAQNYQQTSGELGKKPVELPDMDPSKWKEKLNKTALFDLLSQNYDLSKSLDGPEVEDLVGSGEDPLLAYWMRGILKRRAEATGMAPLAEESELQMVNLLLNIRKATQDLTLNKQAEKNLSSDEKIRIAALMANGEALFSSDLGVPLSEFLSSLTKEDMRMLFAASPKS